MTLSISDTFHPPYIGAAPVTFGARFASGDIHL
jgi:hypothetical protein